MQLTDILARMGGLQSMSRELGISESQVSSGAEALIPAILGGLKKQAQSQPAGIEGLGGPLGGLIGGQPGGSASKSGLASMLDINRDGNPLDDILRMAGTAMH